MWFVLSYHAVVYLVSSYHCLPDPERKIPYKICCFTWQAYGQLRFRTYDSQGDELLSRYGAAARKGRADFRHVKSSTQQNAMAFERIYGSFAPKKTGTSSVRKRRLIRGGGGSVSRISNTNRPPDTGGGVLSITSCTKTSASALPPTGPRDCIHRVNRPIHLWAMNQLIGLCDRPSVTGRVTGPTSRRW